MALNLSSNQGNLFQAIKDRKIGVSFVREIFGPPMYFFFFQSELCFARCILKSRKKRLVQRVGEPSIRLRFSYFSSVSLPVRLNDAAFGINPGKLVRLRLKSPSFVY